MKSNEKLKVCVYAIDLPLVKEGGGERLSPGKGLMTHVWTNGSQWSYLLIQPHYFTSIKYVCPDRSVLPPQTLMQVNNMLIRRLGGGP